jgi:hypothetical protein
MRAFFPALLTALLVGGLTARADDTKADHPVSTAEVSGTVTLSGKPLPAGWIAFHGKDARGVVRVTVDEGKYRARNVPTGENVRITIDVEGVRALAEDLREQLLRAGRRAELLKTAKVDDPKLSDRIKDLKARLKVMEDAQRRLRGIKVDAQYAAPETTPISITVREGKQTHDVELK